jgi:hypothetical protein
MTAPVVNRLLGQISATSDLMMAAEMKAHLACYYARTGDLELAADLTAELRSQYGSGKHPRLSILIMLSEGIRYFFADQDPRSGDRLRRACLLSAMIRDRELISLTEAWMSHYFFNAGKHVEFGAALAKAADSLDPENLPARCRIALLLTAAFLVIGDHPSSRYWFIEAREAALSYGDQAAIGAVTYNRAALQVYVLRTSNARGLEHAQNPTLVLSEVQTAINYQRVAQLSSLDHLLYTARVGALIAAGSFAEAATCAQELLGSVGVPLANSELMLATFDHAYSQYMLGENESLQRLLSSQDFLQSCWRLEAGDRLIVLSGLSRLEPGFLDPTIVKEVSVRRPEAEREFIAETVLLTDAIRRFRREAL